MPITEPRATISAVLERHAYQHLGGEAGAILARCACRWEPKTGPLHAVEAEHRNHVTDMLARALAPFDSDVQLPSTRDFDLIEVALDAAATACQGFSASERGVVDPLAREYLSASEATQRLRKVVAR